MELGEAIQDRNEMIERIRELEDQVANMQGEAYEMVAFHESLKTTSPPLGEEGRTNGRERTVKEGVRPPPRTDIGVRDFLKLSREDKDAFVFNKLNELTDLIKGSRTTKAPKDNTNGGTEVEQERRMDAGGKARIISNVKMDKRLTIKRRNTLETGTEDDSEIPWEEVVNRRKRKVNGQSKSTISDRNNSDPRKSILTRVGKAETMAGLERTPAPHLKMDLKKRERIELEQGKIHLP